MTNKTYKVDQRCGSNPHCMRLHVASPEAVSALACVFPSMAATGGYTGGTDFPKGVLVEEGTDLIEYNGFTNDDAFTAYVWHENDKSESLEVNVRHVSKWNSEEARTVRTMVTTVWSKVLAQSGADGKREYRREIKGKWWKTPRINGRREVAKAVALFLEDVTSAEAIEDRKQRAALAAQIEAEQMERAVIQWELAVDMAVALYGMPSKENKKSAEQIKTSLAKYLEQEDGTACSYQLRRCAKDVRDRLCVLRAELSADDRFEYDSRVSEATSAAHERMIAAK